MPIKKVVLKLYTVKLNKKTPLHPKILIVFADNIELIYYLLEVIQYDSRQTFINKSFMREWSKSYY